jgi:hypothetical protein
VNREAVLAALDLDQAVLGEQPPETRRSDAGQVRLSGVDVSGLVLCAEHYAAQCDVLAAAQCRVAWGSPVDFGLGLLVEALHAP